MTKKLVYNGKSSDEMGLVIQATPVYSMTERDVSTTHVPGRNGDIITDNGCYKNINRTYSLAKGYAYGNQPLKTTVKNGQELFEWLTSAKGKYVRLEDDYDPHVYRLATYVGNGSIVDLFDKALTFEATFNCKPQRFFKHGDIPVEYDYGQVSVNVNNRTHYEAKPIIKIENIPGGASANTMMSVKDSSGAEVSLVSFKGDANSISTISIDSETEECYYNDNSNASNKVSMNGKNFPILREGNTNISLQQYDRSDYEIPSYNTVIQSQQQICESSFSTRETTIASYEEKYNIRSYSSLIAERENSFEADAYFTRLSEICDDGVVIDNKVYAENNTIEGPDSFLSPTYVEFRTGDAASANANIAVYHLEDILEAVSNAEGYDVQIKNDPTLIVYVKEDGTNVIRKHSIDNRLILSVKSKSPEETFATLGIIRDFGDSANGDLPNYILLNLVFDDAYALTSVQYLWNTSDYVSETNKQMIFYKNKVGITGLMGKAGWYAIGDGEVLISYNWNWIRKSFLMNGNLLSMGNNFDFKFVCFCDKSKDRMQYDFGENSAKIFKTYLISSNQIEVHANKKGYYKSKNLTDDSWKFYEADSLIKTGFEAKNSFKIEYLKEPPKYSDERDWPTWLNSKVVCFNRDGSETEEQDPLLCDHFRIKVNQNAWYRKYETIDDIERPTDFVQLDANDYIGISKTEGENIGFDDNIAYGRYYSEQWPEPESVPEFPYDRAISIGNQTPTLYPYLPDWLTYEVEMKVKLNSDPTKELAYTREKNKIGYSYFELVCINGPDGYKHMVCYTEHINPSINDGVYVFDDSLGYPVRLGTINNKTVIDPDTNEIQYEVAITGETLTLSNYFYKWIRSDGAILYTKRYWYANVNDKVYDIDSNEIGYVSVEPTVYYYAGDKMEAEGGFYKYDNTSAWVYYSKGDKTNPIIKTGFKDSTMFYFIESFPDSYRDYYGTVNVWETVEDEPTEFTTEKSVPEEGDEIYSLLTHETIGKVVSYEDDTLTVTMFDTGSNVDATKKSNEIPEWIDLLDIERLPEGNVNPLSINFKIKNAQSAGYYKSNSLVHWKNYDVNDIVLTSLVNETNTISHLVPRANSSEALENVRIIVTPKWWML